MARYRIGKHVMVSTWYTPPRIADLRAAPYWTGAKPMADYNNEKPTVRAMMDIIPSDWDKRPVSLAHEVMGFLESVKDQGTSIDSGTDGVTGDLWVTVQGVEYFIQVGKSKRQLNKDSNSLSRPVPKATPTPKVNARIYLTRRVRVNDSLNRFL